MDHAEARERLADALLAPRDGGLESALAAACAPCSRELDALRAIGALLATAAPDSLAAPPSLRERVMAAVGETGAPAAAPIPLRPRRRLLPLVAAMAAVGVLVAGPAGGGGPPAPRPAGGSALRVLHRARRRPHVDRLDALERRPRLLVGPGLGDRLALATRRPLPRHGGPRRGARAGRRVVGALGSATGGRAATMRDMGRGGNTIPQPDVTDMFDAIAPVYDRLNTVLTLGADARWRRRAAPAPELSPGDRGIDVACGTGKVGA